MAEILSMVTLHFGVEVLPSTSQMQLDAGTGRRHHPLMSGQIVAILLPVSSFVEGMRIGRLILAKKHEAYLCSGFGLHSCTWLDHGWDVSFPRRKRVYIQMVSVP